MIFSFLELEDNNANNSDISHKHENHETTQQEQGFRSRLCSPWHETPLIILLPTL
jgi:hypothetical protein